MRQEEEEINQKWRKEQSEIKEEKKTKNRKEMKN